MLLIYPQKYHVVQDQNGIVLMKSYDEQECIDWCKEHGMEYKVQK